MAETRMITQLCIVVRDVRQASANWARILGVPQATIVTIFPDGILHYTHGQATDYKDCQVALYRLDHIVLELIQPGTTPSPWKSFLERNGQGVFHFCMLVNNRNDFQQRLTDIGVDLPYHIGYHSGGSYSYVDSREQLGVELSANHQADNTDVIQKLLNGMSLPLDELR
ncbi:MAG TPA: VOC family protein [Roseiflexaceae bacterium]|nr:VOC family protein [Roseiflexaceae bacterium]